MHYLVKCNMHYLLNCNMHYMVNCNMKCLDCMLRAAVLPLPGRVSSAPSETLRTFRDIAKFPSELCSRQFAAWHVCGMFADFPSELSRGGMFAEVRS